MDPNCFLIDKRCGGRNVDEGELSGSLFKPRIVDIYIV